MSECEEYDSEYLEEILRKRQLKKGTDNPKTKKQVKTESKSLPIQQKQIKKDKRAVPRQH